MAEESVEEKILAERTAKAEGWKRLGFNPYGNGFRPSSLAQALHERFDGQTPESLAAEKPGPFSVAGRIVRVADFGKSAFLTVQDRSGVIQAQVRKDTLGDEAFQAFKLVDVADFVGVEGTLFKSRTGELTIAAARFLPLTKALRPLPAKFAKGDDAEKQAWAEKHALADIEERQRRRYVDLLANPSVRDTFKRRTKLVQFIRRFLDERDFLEVETPMMHPLVSGAAARPFVTHHNAFDIPLYMRIAPELYLKRLVVGGFDRVYEINRNFRNEGVSTRHNPEFTMLEFYQAYATYEDLMDLTEEMVCEAARAVCGTTALAYGPHTLRFERGWPRIPMTEAIRQKVKSLSDKDFADADKLRAVALEGAEGAEREAVKTMNQGELIGFLFEKHVEGELIQPTFITRFPVETSPLARRNDAEPAITDRFELFCVGREIANAFSELNDPVDQRGRFQAQLDAKRRGQQETMDYDEDYLRALEHGMPPTAGEGIGIDRLAMLLTDSQTIRDVILFPLLRPESGSR